MSQELIHLVSAADHRFFPGLLVALGSALACASGHFDYSITVLDGGISSDDWENMNSHLQRIGREKHIEIRLARIDATGALVKGMPSRRGSPLTYARLAVPSVMHVQKVIYIDSDVVCLRGVEEFWTGLNTGAALVAVRDPLGVLGRDPLTRQLPNSKHKLPYFNAGIIGMNLDVWRQPEISSQIESLIINAKRYRYVDQSLLNLVFHDQWLELPGDCNCLLTLASCGKLKDATKPANYHYIGARKPWLSSVSNFYRHVPNLLFDQMHQMISGKFAISARSISSESMAKARKKRCLYQFILPSRGRQYSDALTTTENAVNVVDRLLGNRKSA